MEQLCAGCARLLPADAYRVNALRRVGLDRQCLECCETPQARLLRGRSARLRAQRTALGLRPDQIRQLRAAALGTPCPGCRTPLDPSAEADHVQSLALGGRHCVENLQVICHDCHVVKSRADAELLRHRLGRRPAQVITFRP